MAKLVDLKEYRGKKDYNCPEISKSIIEAYKVHQKCVEYLYNEAKAMIEWYKPQSK